MRSVRAAIGRDHGLAAWRSAWLAPPVAALGLIFAYPFAWMVGRAFSAPDGGYGLAAFEAILRSRGFIASLLATGRISLTATAICVVLGVTLALAIRFAPFPGARVVSRVIDAYLAFPSFLIAIALTFVYGSSGFLHSLLAGAGGRSFLFGFWGVVIAEVTYYTPFVVRPLLAALDSLDIAQLEAASSLGARPIEVLRRIVLPAMMPSLFAGGSLCLLLTINEFGIILIMGVKHSITLPMLIYGKAIEQFDYPGASVVALCNVALSLSLYFGYRRLLDRLPA